MECLILGAGAGSRLMPLTARLPKPLLPLGPTTILGRLVDQVAPLGARRILCNLHHHAEAAEDYFARADLALPVVTRREDRLRGPAGAMLTFEDELTAADTVLVVSGDLYLGDGALAELVRRHHESGSDLSVLAVEVDDGSRFGVFRLDDGGRPTALDEKPAWAAGRRSWVSGGAYCLRPELLKRVPTEGLYDFGAHLIPELLAERAAVGLVPWLGRWDDLGTTDSYRRAVLDDLAPAGGDARHVAPTARVHPSALLTGRVLVADDAVVGAGARLHDTVVLPGATVPDHTTVADGCVA
ncbi:nucleotidyltransferase family protein [Streptomyces sp. UH6]|uniref:nucleotidyltransferase family protein n=1 Tax=Streptomyces sp. UH6 TaxID=2748379 RepID=UPI0015D4E08B|nr:nucleotidyltransferase family protein [Streptomyces sp. UH6]NYV75838.1 NTP transferase domain-containing protein [Streptomyces sp. UH6]